MGEQHRRIEVQHIPATESVHALAVEGFLSFRLVDELHRRFDAVFEQRPQVHSLLIDLLASPSFEPGVPARSINWLQARTSQVRSVVVVTLSPVLIATARAAQVLVPDVTIHTASTRPEGLLLASRTGRTRTKSHTGVRSTLVALEATAALEAKKTA